MDTAERRAMIGREFERRFGAAPEVWTRAPGRVDLMGSHTDYNLGYVMTMTIDRDTWLAVRPRADRQVNVYSLDASGGGAFSLEQVEHDPAHGWTEYVRGVAWALAEAGHRLTGFDGLIHSTVPFSSGLSSSAALEMAVALAFQEVSGFRLDPVAMALLGQRAENRFVGINCGILDQYSSAMGQEGCALLLDCRDLTSRPVPIAPGLSVVICDTRAERHLAGTEYGERRSQCEQGVELLRRYYPNIRSLRDVTRDQLAEHEAGLPPVVARRCRFIVEENQRVLDLAAALPGGDAPTLARLLSASYAGARDLYEIGAPAMEAMMGAMLAAPGVVGARQAGAGFGGCMVALVESACVADFASAVAAAYAAATGIELRVYAVQPAPGAGLLASR